MTALFDITDHYVSRTSGASLRGLVEHVTALQLPVVRPEPAAPTEQVMVLSAHAALGHEWDLVVIAGLQDGLWPNTVPRGGVLGTQRLLDELDGVTKDASMRAPLLAEERRLLVTAMGRARRRLLVTAVDSDAGGGGHEAVLPSAFFFEIAQWADGDGEPVAMQPVSAPRVLSAAAVVGRLRAVVCAPACAVDDADRDCAATQLARLAKAGVPGADPSEWHGLAPVSTSDPLCDSDDLVTLTPSTLQALNDCPLRWLAERHGGTNTRELPSAVGSVLHALFAEPGRSESQLLAELDRVWGHLPFGAQWYSANELARHRAMIQAFVQWRAQSRSELTEVGVEVDIDGALEDGSGQARKIRLRGRADRLERDPAGRLVIVDIKTGKTPVSKDDAQQHAQLAMYQLAVAEGLVRAGDEPGGARLVYVGKSGAAGVAERKQDPLTPAARDEPPGQQPSAVGDRCGHRGRMQSCGACLLSPHPRLTFRRSRTAQRIGPPANRVGAFLGVRTASRASTSTPRARSAAALIAWRSIGWATCTRWVSWALRSWVSSCMTSSRVCVRTASCSVRCCSNRFHSSSAARASCPRRPSCSYIAEMAVSDSLSAAKACSAASWRADCSVSAPARAAFNCAASARQRPAHSWPCRSRR